VSEKYEEQLKQLERFFIVSNLLFNQYQSRYQKLFLYTAPSARCAHITMVWLGMKVSFLPPQAI
jgi:hypothetical protein